MKPPAFQFYADDFLAGVADMTQAEVGAYILLLCHQWNRGSAPVEPERQQLLAKGPVSEHVLAKFDRSETGELKNARLEKEREKQEQYREKQRLKGIQSGKVRGTTVEPRLNHGSTELPTGGQPDTQPEGNSPSPSPSPSPNINAVRAAKAAQPTDSEWLAQTQKNPAYAAINVGLEYGKCQAWNGARNQTVTRRKFIAWLNRAERPMPRQLTVSAQTPQSVEHKGWRETLKRIRPESTYDGSWATLPESVKAEILNAKPQ